MSRKLERGGREYDTPEARQKIGAFLDKHLKRAAGEGGQVAMHDDPLGGLDAIDWSALTHAYGAASDVPDLIRGLASPHRRTRRDAMGELYGNIWHQGTVYEASALAVPFLLALVARDQTPDRDQILCLLHSLATGSSYLDVHATPDSPLFQEERSRPDFPEKVARELGWVAAAHEAAAEGIDLYLALLGHPQPALRLGAAHTLSAFPERASAVAPALRALAEREADPPWRGGAVLAVALLADPSAEGVALLERRLRGGNHAGERIAAAFGLAGVLGERAPTEAALELARAAAAPGATETCLEGLPWDWTAELRPDAGLNRIGPDAGAGAVEYLADALRRAGDEVDASFIVDALLALVFPAGPACDRHPLDFSTLTAAQRRALGAIADSDAAWRGANLIICNLQNHGVVRDAFTPEEWTKERLELRHRLATA